MLKGMELRHLRYFVAIADEESMTRAGARLHVSQPTLSRQLRDLEDELGVALFDHGARAIRLTSVGRVFLEEARASLKRAELAVETVRAVAGGGRRRINVGYSPSPSFDLLPSTLRYFHKTNPEVTVQLHDFSGSKIVRCLLSGELDLALTVWGSSCVRAGLALEELRRIPLVVALPAQHRLVKASKLNAKRLLTEPLITYTRADYPDYHERIARWFAPFKRQPDIVEEHDSIGALLASVAAGRGVALVAQTLDGSLNPDVAFRPVFPPPSPIRLGIVYLKKKTVPLTTFHFIAAAKRAKSTLE